jgi:dipeptidyl aminopeptidase/acylaminoacyl peptidase
LACPQSECDFPRWYPDQQKLAYNRLDLVSDTALPRYSIWWLDIASGKTQPVFQDASFASYAPEFSPDGEWLSYVSAGENMLRLYDLRNGQQRSVPLGSQSPIPETWGPDGNSVLFGSAVSPDDGAPTHTKVYSLASGAVIDLGGPAPATDFSAVWSPDGQWIAIDRSIPAPGAPGSSQIWLVRSDGAQAHMLLGEDGASYGSVNWTPNSGSLTYSRFALENAGNTRGRYDTYIVNVETGETKLLMENADLATFLP